MLTQEIKNLIIKAAIAAPSADNSQPFKFQWCTDDSLSLWIDKLRSGKASDNRFVLSDIALGAVIENIVIQSDDSGLNTEINYFPNGEKDEFYIASIKFFTSIVNPNKQVNLSKEIPRRTTDRRFPFKGPISESDQAKLDSAAHIYDCDIMWFDTKNSIKQVLPVIQQAESIRFKSETLHHELFSTIKFGKEEALEGMHISVLAIEKPAQPFFKLMKKWAFMNIINKVGGATMLGFRSVRIPILFSPALLLITMNEKNRMSVIKTGRAIQRVWLQASQQGLSVQPYAAPGIFSLGFISCESEFSSPLNTISQQMHEIVNGDNKTPNKYGLMFLRIGYSKPIIFRSKRRAINSFLMAE